MRRLLLAGAALAGLAVTAVVHAQGSTELFVENARPATRSTKAVTAEKRVRSAPTTGDMRVMGVRTPVLSGSDAVVTLNLPGASLSANGAITSRSGDNYTWVGRVAGEPLSSVVLVVRSGKVTGEVRSKAGIFRVTPLEGDEHAVVKVNEANLPADHDSEEAPAPKQKSKRATGKSGADAAGSEYAPPSKTYTVKVLVAYTAAAERAEPDILAKIDEAEASANLSYERSDVRVRLKVAGVYKTTYEETGQSSTDKEMTEVLERRGRYGADVAVLVVSDLKNGSKSICGTSLRIAAPLSKAFTVVKASCLNLTMAHEIGHLIGVRHNWEKDQNEGVCDGYGHGLYNIAGGWRTIMAYACDPPASGACKRYPMWSNPRMKDENGAPLGHVRYADEARCLNTRISIFCSGKAPCGRDQ